MKKWILVISLLFVAGCGSDVAIFADGVITGLAIETDNANKAIDEISENVEAAKKLNAELEIALETVKDNPLAAVGMVEPNMPAKIIALTENLKELEAKAEEFKDEEGKVEWQSIITMLLLGGFSGGTGVNLYKNRKQS